MSNLTLYPVEDGYESKLSQPYNGTDSTIYVDTIPVGTLALGQKVIFTINPGTSYAQAIEVSGWSAGQLIVSSTTVEKANGTNYTTRQHGAKSPIIMSDNFANWEAIQVSLTSKLDNNGGNGTTYATTGARDAALGGNGVATLPYRNIYVTASALFYNYNLGTGQWEAVDTGTATPNASTTVAGKVEVATIGEALAGTGTGGSGAPTSIGGDIFLQATELQHGINTASNFIISASRAASAETIALKTVAGTDPSATDPIHIAFRNATAGTGDYTILTVAAATSIVIPSTATMGATNSVPFRLWLVGVNDGGTFRLGLVNTQLSGGGIYYLQNDTIISSTIMDTSSDSAGVFYTGTAVTSKCMNILGYLDYTLATVGTWGTAPSKIQIYGKGVKLPGTVVQRQVNQTGAVATGTTVIPYDDTIPQITEGNEYMTQAITPTATANKLRIESLVYAANGAGGSQMIACLFQDSTADSLSSISSVSFGAGQAAIMPIDYTMTANTTSSTTFRIRAGGNNSGTTTFNGSGGGIIFGGVMNSRLIVTEIMV